METTVQAVAPTVAAGWGGMLGGWVGGSYQRVRRFIADHRKGLSHLRCRGFVFDTRCP